MPRAREWMGDLLLHAPAPLRSLRNLPFVGSLIHRLEPPRSSYGSKSLGARGKWARGRPLARTEPQDRARLPSWRSRDRPCKTRLAERLRPGMVFYDLGANLGLFTLLAARLVSDRRKSFQLRARSGKCGATSPQHPTQRLRECHRRRIRHLVHHRQLHFVAADRGSPDHGIGKLRRAAPTELAGTLIACVSLDDFIRRPRRRPTRSNATSKAPKWKRCAAPRSCCNRHAGPGSSWKCIHQPSIRPRAPRSSACGLPTHGSRRASRAGRPCEKMILSCTRAR